MANGQGVLGMKPCQKRRLAAEQALYNKFQSFNECQRACERFALEHNVNVTFNSRSVTQYIEAYTNLSMNRLKVFAAVLGVTDYLELDEIYTAPRTRGVGLFWEGDLGHRVRDIDLRVDR